MSSAAKVRRIIAVASTMIAAAGDASPLFDDDALLDVELRGPITALIDEKDDKAEFDFELVTGGVAVELKVRRIAYSTSFPISATGCDCSG